MISFYDLPYDETFYYIKLIVYFRANTVKHCYVYMYMYIVHCAFEKETARFKTYFN